MDAPGKPDYSFPKAARVRKRADFQNLYKSCKPVFGPHLVCYLRQNPEPTQQPARLGLTVPKKTGNAVCRNRLKRQLRSIFRLKRPDLPPGLEIIINTKRNASEANYLELSRQFERALRKVGVTS